MPTTKRPLSGAAATAAAKRRADVLVEEAAAVTREGGNPHAAAFLLARADRLMPRPVYTFDPPLGSAWIDTHHDVWTMGSDGIMHSPETAPFPPAHVAKKWGPLLPVVVETEPCSHPDCEVEVGDDRVDEQTGRRYCTDEHRDDHSQDLLEERVARQYAAGDDVPRDPGPFTIRVGKLNPWGGVL
jgi:hypothetical protein